MRKLVLGLAVAGCLQLSAATIFFDSFTTSQGALTKANSGTPTVTDGPAANTPISGISRTLISQYTGGSFGFDSQIGGGLYLVAADTTTTGTGTLLYNGGPLDMSAAGMRFIADLSYYDINGGSLQFFIRSAAGESVSAPLGISALGPISALVSGFTGAASSGAVTGFGFYTNLSAASKDVAYSSFSISNVPEPGTYALMGLGLAALAALRRRK